LKPETHRVALSARRSRLSHRLLGQYFLTVVGYVVALLALVLLAQRFCAVFIWYADDPLYRMLQFVKEHIILFVGALALLGWAAITYIFLSKPLGYLDEAVAAAEQMAVSPETPVALSPAMLDTQNELNLVREAGLRDAAAAKEAEQRKNDLIVYLAHDLKTPLTSVIGYLSLLRDEPEISPELRARYTGIALDKAERLEELINEFFDITRFNLTSLTLEKETVNLTRMLEQISSEFLPVMSEKRLSWELQLERDVQILCDPDKLERVFDNLIRNAVSYSSPDTRIALTLSRSGGSAVVCVKNHGRTIPADKLSRVFEQFFRLDSSRSSATGGSGLGLAIAKEIVLLHGGTISAESADESVTFTVTLPAVRNS
jgi:two-component system sensor histidine kinase VanS